MNKKVDDKMRKRFARLQKKYGNEIRMFRHGDSLVFALSNKYDHHIFDKMEGVTEFASMKEGAFFADGAYDVSYSEEDIKDLALLAGWGNDNEEDGQSNPFGYDPEEEEDEDEKSYEFHEMDPSEVISDVHRVDHAINKTFEYLGVDPDEVYKKAGIPGVYEIDTNTRLEDLCKILNVLGYRLSLHKSPSDMGIFKRV